VSNTSETGGIFIYILFSLFGELLCMHSFDGQRWGDSRHIYSDFLLGVLGLLYMHSFIMISIWETAGMCMLWAMMTGPLVNASI
jgi:hypothetical protein